jgi:lipopolysaccharide export system protein LptC
METEAGYLLETDGLTAQLNRTHVESASSVVVSAPMGDIRADSFVLKQDEADPSSYLLVFNGGVKLVYQPSGQSP